MCNKIINNEVKDIISKFKQKININTSVKDLTHLKTYSIDDSETYEIDDAISLEKISPTDSPLFLSMVHTLPSVRPDQNSLDFLLSFSIRTCSIDPIFS